MDDFPECEQFTGYKRRICRGETDHKISGRNSINEYREHWGLGPIDGGVKSTPLNTGSNPNIRRPQQPRRPGGVGTELKKILTSWWITACGSCGSHAKTMDKNGIEWCEANIPMIVGWMKEEAANRHVGWVASLTELVPAFGMSPEHLVQKAIRNAKAETQKQNPPKYVGIEGPLTRHLAYHIWPKRGNGVWQWNVQQVLRRIDQFDGVRAIGVVTDEDSDSLEDVQKAFSGMRIDHWIQEPNNPRLGEGTTFPKMLQLLPQGLNDVTFYGHAKGVKYDDPHHPTKRWSEMLYELNLDYLGDIDKALREFPLVGSFRRYGGTKDFKWHFSGTFFWLHNATAMQRELVLEMAGFYGCVEAWPSRVFSDSEAACLFADKVGHLYDVPLLNELQPAMEQWRMARAAQPNLEQLESDHRPSGNGVTDLEFYEESFPQRESFQEMIAIHTNAARAVQGLGCKTVLELGSGLGAFLLGANRIGLDAQGIDVSRLQREFALSKGVSKFRYESADLTTYRIPAPVDCIVSCEVFEHLTDEELDPICRQLAANCKWFYFTSTPHPASNDREWGHVNVKQQGEWIAFFARYGLTYARGDGSLVEWGMIFTGSRR